MSTSPADGPSVKYHRYNPIPEAVKAGIVATYEAGASMKAVATQFRCCTRTVSDLLKDKGIARRSLRLYGVNDDYFAAVDTAEKAYWLGFISADGYVGGRIVNLRLAGKDRAHVEAFRTAIGAESPIRDEYGHSFGKARPLSGVTVSSAKMVSDLAALGLVGPKTYRIKPWPGPARLLSPYWLGVIDGDGYWSMSKGHNRSMGLVGNEFLTRGFADFVAERVGRVERVCLLRGRCWRVAYHDIKTLHTIADLLYKDAPLMCLDRKRQVALAIRALPLPADWSWLTAERLIALRARHETWRAVAEEIGVTEDMLMHLRRKAGIDREQRDWTGITREQLLAMYAEHGQWKKVADLLGTFPSTVERLRARLNIPTGYRPA